MNEQPANFEQFALDHLQHAHCSGCGGCLLLPDKFIQPAWCVGCRDRLKAHAERLGVPVPWHNKDFEFDQSGRVI